MEGIREIYVLVTLGLVLVVGAASLEQRLIDPSTTSDDADGCTCRSRHCFLRTTRKPDSRLVVV